MKSWKYAFKFSFNLGIQTVYFHKKQAFFTEKHLKLFKQVKSLAFIYYKVLLFFPVDHFSLLLMWHNTSICILKNGTLTKLYIKKKDFQVLFFSCTKNHIKKKDFLAFSKLLSSGYDRHIVNFFACQSKYSENYWLWFELIIS